MKIERLNDRQIRCTLTREDLAKRGLRLSEFAYGTKKARALFQDMMEQANYELGFDAQDYPLMIEAVPMGPECLVLIVTMVDDPEELDTRFSSFGPMLDEEDEDFDEEEEPYGDEPEDNTFMKMLRGMQEENDFSALADQHKARLNPVNARNIPGRTPAPQPRAIEDKGRDKDKEKARNRKEPIGRRGCLSPARARRTARLTALTASLAARCISFTRQFFRTRPVRTSSACTLSPT